MPVAVADLVALTADDAGFALLDVGLYLDGPDGTTKAILRGLGKGAVDVGIAPASPLVLADADLAGISAAALQRMADVAALYCLRRVLGRWHLAHRANGEEPIVPGDAIRRGVLWEEKQALIRRIADLEAEVDKPIQSPSSGGISVVDRPPSHPCGC